MPLLPVTRLLAIGSAILLGIASPAAARTEVRGIIDLLRDQEVIDAGARFVDQAKASVVYVKCAQTWGITKTQQAYQKDMFARATKAYADAFYNAYIRRTGIPPAQKVIDYYAQYIENTQQEAVNTTYMHLQAKRGCQAGPISVLFKNTEQQHRQEVLEAEKEKHKPRRYDPWTPPDPI